MDNSVKRNMAWLPSEPYGFKVTYFEEGDELSEGATLIAPPYIPRPRFNYETQQWETAPEVPATPTDQDKINAQIMLAQAKQKKEQDAFNAQVLLQIAKIGGNK